MANGIRTGDPRGFNKRRNSKFCEGSQRTYWPKRFWNNNKDENNSPKILNGENHQTSSQKFKQLINDISISIDIMGNSNNNNSNNNDNIAIIVIIVTFYY